MNNNGYWSGILRQRLSRRRALGASGATALGAVLLTACGGEHDQGSSALTTKPVDTSKRAIRGGTVKTYWEADISDYDVHNTRSAGRGIPNLAYSRFVQLKPGYLTPKDYEVAGDIAESWEWSADGLTLTMKLRQGAGWAPLPPVNSRPVDIEDIAYTWRRYSSIGSNRSDYLNALNPDAPVLSLSTPDVRTFVWKLAFPATWLLSLMASSIKQSYMLPKESESQYDLRKTPIGSGPFYISNYVPSGSWTLKRNPNFYDKDHPYIDEIERPIIIEYATQAAQFRTGGIYDFGDMRAEDILATKRELPALNLYQVPLDPSGGGVAQSNSAYFGWKPDPPERTPFRDERVRQAYSMSWDRDTWIDVFYNVPGFRAAGLPTDARWYSALNAEFEGWWLDPKGKDFGPNAKYFQHDLTEAKKLLAAAGYPNGLEVQSNWSTTYYGAEFGRPVEVLEGMARDAGFKFLTNNPSTAEWPERYRDSRGNFEGIAYRGVGVAGVDSSTVVLLKSYYLSTPGSPIFTGFDPAGRGDFSGDPTLETMIRNASKEFDVERQKSIVNDIQRYLAKALYTIRYPGSSSRFDLQWPVLRNAYTYQGGQIPYYYEWIDEQQPPLKKA